jgi:hypothetical protein
MLSVLCDKQGNSGAGVTDTGHGILFPKLFGGVGCGILFLKIRKSRSLERFDSAERDNASLQQLSSEGRVENDFSVLWKRSV